MIGTSMISFIKLKIILSYQDNIVLNKSYEVCSTV